MTSEPWLGASMRINEKMLTAGPELDDEFSRVVWNLLLEHGRKMESSYADLVLNF